jgi:hypothetical protein
MAVVSRTTFPARLPLVIGPGRDGRSRRDLGSQIAAPLARSGVAVLRRHPRAEVRGESGQRRRRVPGRRPGGPGDCSADPCVPCPSACLRPAPWSCRHEHASGGRGAGAGLAFVAVGAMIGGAPRAVSGLAVTVAAIGGGVARGPGARVKAAGHGDPPGALEHRRHRPERAHERGAGAPGGSGAAAPAWQACAVLWIPVPGGRYDMAPLDLLLFTAAGEHWRRRRGSRMLSAPAAQLLLRPDRCALCAGHGPVPVPARRARTSPTVRSRRVGSGSGRCAWIW